MTLGIVAAAAADVRSTCLAAKRVEARNPLLEPCLDLKDLKVCLRATLVLSTHVFLRARTRVYFRGVRRGVRVARTISRANKHNMRAKALHVHKLTTWVEQPGTLSWMTANLTNEAPASAERVCSTSIFFLCYTDAMRLREREKDNYSYNANLALSLTQNPTSR